MAGRGTGRGDAFTSTGLVAHAISVLARIDPALVPDGVVAPDPMDRGRTDARDKTGLLAHALARGGPGAILEVGRRVRELRGNPVVDVLVRDPDAEVFATKWMRLEGYNHASHRTLMVCPRAGALECERRFADGPATPAENLLIAGMVAGLLAWHERPGLVLETGGMRVTWAGGDVLAGFDPCLTDTFRLVWQPDRSQAGAGGGAEDRGATSMSARLLGLLSADPGRSWRLRDAARMLAVSDRSLQRALSAEARTFSTVLRQARVQEAARLLAGDAPSLAEIGYCCGYADQAHFQRDFVRVLNMTPRRFRGLQGR